MTLGSLPEADIEVVCPRCGGSSLERFYGPCDSCRADLRATISKDKTELTASEYVPKMNVTPNAVASKE